MTYIEDTINLRICFETFDMRMLNKVRRKDLQSVQSGICSVFMS